MLHACTCFCMPVLMPRLPPPPPPFSCAHTFYVCMIGRSVSMCACMSFKRMSTHTFHSLQSFDFLYNGKLIPVHSEFVPWSLQVPTTCRKSLCCRSATSLHVPTTCKKSICCRSAMSLHVPTTCKKSLCCRSAMSLAKSLSAADLLCHLQKVSLLQICYVTCRKSLCCRSAMPSFHPATPRQVTDQMR